MAQPLLVQERKKMSQPPRPPPLVAFLVLGLRTKNCTLSCINGWGNNPCIARTITRHAFSGPTINTIGILMTYKN